MSAEIGHHALILALLLALVQATIPLFGAARGQAAWMALARPTAFGQLGFIALAFLALIHAFVVSDFSVVIVAANSHTDKPLLYKISGAWGNHEGSLVLWVLILALFGAAIAAFGHGLPEHLRARVLAVQAMIAAGFLAFLLFTSDPFARLLPPPVQGAGLNPLLQDPGLAFHPPFLYLGYVGFSVAFAFAVAALIEGEIGPAWARWVRPWTLAAWAFLTLGIALGSWWAYYELGWGGFWFWDPVENASLMPWLAGTALLHSVGVVERRGALKAWTVLLAILTFSLSLLGTFLVRSGVLTSVHAFATDPARGMFILAFLALTVGGALALYAWRAPRLAAEGDFAPVSREGGLVLNNWLLACAAGTVLLGTLYPLVLDALTGEKVSVGPPFFNLTFGPIMAALVVVMAAGPLLAWKRARVSDLLPRLSGALVLAVLGALAIWWWTGGPAAAAFGIGLGLWLIGGIAADLGGRLRLFRVRPGESWRRMRGLPRRALATMIAHAGLAVTLIGITANTAWTDEWQGVLHPGQGIALGGYVFTFIGAGPAAGPNYTALRGDLLVTRDARMVARLLPETRTYTAPPTETTEAAIRPTWRGDLYAVIGDAESGGAYAMRLYVKPLVSWIWGGAALMALGGALSLSERRHAVAAAGIKPAAVAARAGEA